VQVLIDGDIFRYRCAFAAEKNYYLLELVNASGYREYTQFDTKKGAEQYGERTTKTTNGAFFRIWSRREVQPLENCLQIVKSSLQTALDDIATKYAVPNLHHDIFLSGKENFRTEVAKTKPYKGNREETPKPVYYKDVGDYLTNVWGAITTEGYEADDALGIGAMEAKERGEAYIVVSNDKDLDQIPGDHYNWITKEFYTVSAKEGRTRFYEQLLSGDATDNVPGLPGIGPAKAKEALAKCKSPREMLAKCEEMYRGYAGQDDIDRAYLVEQADLVWIMKKKNEKWSDTKEGKEFVAKYITTSG
jgi:hypothetical protein